jgi:hypothetical protein
MIYVLPALISLGQGFLLVRLMTGSIDRPRLPWNLFAGFLIGLGVSGLLTFTSLLLFNRIEPAYVIGVNLASLVALGVFSLKKVRVPFLKWDQRDTIIILVLAVMTVPTIVHAFLYPYGGWDAWSCWNLKARFLFLGGSEWSNMFDPVMWRSNTDYPLLLPLINVWSWCFGSAPTNIVPLANSCLITFLMAGLLYFSLEALNGLKLVNLLAPAFLLLNAFILKLASSQYSDLLMGTFLLLAITGFLLHKKTKNTGFLQMSVLALGLMSFTKSEGFALSIITIIVLAIAIAMNRENRPTTSRNIWKLILTLAAAFLATGIFKLVYAPESHTFINGLLSTEKPTGSERLEAVFVFLGKEVLSWRWNGLWLLTAAGLILARRKAFNAGLWTIPAIIVAYLAIIISFYWVNTYFDIVWWLAMTMNRILFALTPTIVLWLFLAISSGDSFSPVHHRPSPRSAK